MEDKDFRAKAYVEAGKYLETIEDVDYLTLLGIFIAGAIWGQKICNEQEK